LFLAGMIAQWDRGCGRVLTARW